METNTSKIRTGNAAKRIGVLLIFAVALTLGVWFQLGPELRRPKAVQADLAFQFIPAMDLASLPLATRFDFPLGSEHGGFAYNAQPFTVNRHLGDDLNGIGGENSDRGDPIYAVANGRVIFAEEGGPGWGNVIIVEHAYVENAKRNYVQSYYAHCEEIQVERGQFVHRGEQIATVGTADGKYLAHLHFEMREFTTPFVGAGYRQDTRGWLNPSDFIAAHRGAADDDVGRPVPVD